MPEEKVDALHGIQQKPLDPLQIRDAAPPPAVIAQMIAPPPENIEIMKPEAVGMERNVQEASTREIRSIPQNEPKSISVDVTSVSKFVGLLTLC